MFFEMRGCQVRLVDDQKIYLFFQYLFDWPSLMLRHIIHQGLSVSPVSNRLLNQERSFMPSEGYIAFIFPFVHSYVHYFPSG